MRNEWEVSERERRKGMEADKYAVCLLYNYTALLLTATLKYKRVAMQGLTSSNDNFNSLQQTQQPRRFIMTV